LSLIDEYGRAVRYLRLSVTDRCNLRCLYCRSNVRERCISHDEVLRYEELLRLVDLGMEQGIEKVRLTGGEPFVRKGFMDFLRMLRERHPGMDLRITSNGTLLGEYIGALRELGIGAINISLDSLRPEGFLAATGRDFLPVVRRNLDALLAAGIQVKINAVALKGINQQDVRAFLDFSRSHPVDVRFIEFMPMSNGAGWSEEQFWPADAILAEARKWAELEPCAPQARDRGPARMFSIVGGLGRFGLITPMSNHFCAGCNRLRIASDGRLRTCLFADKEYRLRGILRHPRLGVRFVSEVMRRANRKKPLGADILRQRQRAVAAKSMLSIGG
jgi:cyclic pyranopterin phosphate synthase